MTDKPNMAIDREQVGQLMERVKPVLSESDFTFLSALVTTFFWLTEQLAAKKAKLAELRHALFGNKSEKTKDVKKGMSDTTDTPADKPKESTDKQATADQSEQKNPGEDASKKKKRKKGNSHGRNKADDYTGAKQIDIPHQTLKPGDTCPECKKCRLKGYNASPQIFIFGQAPIGAERYNLEQLRCACGRIFTARAPKHVRAKKYDETAPATIAFLRYGSGYPHYRLAKIQQAVGIPMPPSTQWDIINAQIEPLMPVLDALFNTAAQGRHFNNDDTRMLVLSLKKQILAELEAATDKKKVRTGINTTGFVVRWQEHIIALFVTGRQHAGENLDDLLRRRNPGLKKPHQMCDGLDRNLPKQLKTIVSNCLDHARRKFVEQASNFPTECLHVIDELALVYKADEEARLKKLTPIGRMLLHQYKSKPVMNRLKKWMETQLKTKKIEPNSGLGQAFNYMLKRWDKLTRYLSVPGAQLSNAICERALKKAILHRKNSMLYKTERGALAGDLFMSLIHTAELNGVDPLHYLTELMRHHREISMDPVAWLPWNYRQTLKNLEDAAKRAAA
jgi:transposase